MCRQIVPKCVTQLSTNSQITQSIILHIYSDYAPLPFLHLATTQKTRNIEWARIW